MTTLWQRWFSPRQQIAVDDLPSWAEALRDQAQRNARAQARLALSVEGLGDTIVARLAEQRRQIDALRAALPPDANFDWGALLDALDRLDVLADDRRSGGDDALASGLAMIAQRLGQQLEVAGLRRDRGLGVAVDGAAMRVIATEQHASVAAGTVLRCLRAAVWRGGELVRQGEVVAALAPPQGAAE